MDVVDRVETAPGQEGEVTAVAGEDRVLVLEAAVGDVDDRARAGSGDLGHLDLPQGASDARVGPGQPAAVGGEGEVGDGPVDGPDQLGDLPVGLLRRVEEQQPSVVGGDGEAFPVRVGQQFQYAAQFAGGQ